MSLQANFRGNIAILDLKNKTFFISSLLREEKMIKLRHDVKVISNQGCSYEILKELR